MNAIEIAKKMETDAIKFYSDAARKTRHPAGKKMFETVIEDEKRHLEIVSNILKGLDVHVEDVHPMENIKTVFESLKDEMMKKVEATSDELEAFSIAMQMEKKGLEFYRKLSSDAKSEKEKNLFEKLIFEEQQHYDIFANTYNFLNDTGNWFMWGQGTESVLSYCCPRPPGESFGLRVPGRGWQSVQGPAGGPQALAPLELGLLV